MVIVGVATSSGVESTARQAHELGFHVVLVTDAMTDSDADAHHNSVTRIFPKMSETGTTRQLLDLLDNKERLNMDWMHRTRMVRRRRIPCQRHSACRQRPDGTAVPEPVRQTARRRPVVVDRQRGLGICQSGGGVSG